MKVRADTKALAEPLPGGREGATVAVEPLITGTVTSARAGIESAPSFAKLRMLGLGTPKSKLLKLPVPAFLIHHPVAGPFLVDTGLHASVATKPAENMGRLVTRFLQPEVEPEQDLLAQLRERSRQITDWCPALCPGVEASRTLPSPNRSKVRPKVEYEAMRGPS